MNKKKLKQFVSEHKKEIVLVGGMILTVALCAVGMKKKFAPQKTLDVLPNLADNVDIPTDFAIGKITGLWRDGEWLNAIVDKVTTKDLGRLGNEFVKHGIVPDDTKVTMIIGFIQENATKSS